MGLKPTVQNFAAKPAGQSLLARTKLAKLLVPYKTKGAQLKNERGMEGGIGDEIPCSSIAVDAVLRIGTAGVIWGSCSGSYEANKLGLSGIARASFLAKSAGRFGFQWGLFAAIFSFTRCGVQRYRRQNDWVNALIGGAIAGAAIGAGTRNWKQVAGVTGLVCALYHAADDTKSLQ